MVTKRDLARDGSLVGFDEGKVLVTIKWKAGSTREDAGRALLQVLMSLMDYKIPEYTRYLREHVDSMDIALEQARRRL